MGRLENYITGHTKQAKANKFWRRLLNNDVTTPRQVRHGEIDAAAKASKGVRFADLSSPITERNSALASQALIPGNNYLTVGDYAAYRKNVLAKDPRYSDVKILKAPFPRLMYGRPESKAFIDRLPVYRRYLDRKLPKVLADTAYHKYIGF